MNRNINKTQFYTANLPPGLNIRVRPFKEKNAEFDNSRGWPQENTELVGRHTPIYTTQERYDPKQVMDYLRSGKNYSDENDSDRPSLSDFGAGRTWHDDGLHRIIASRLNRKPGIEADVLRREQFRREDW